MAFETDIRAPQSHRLAGRPETRWRRVLDETRVESSSLTDLLTAAAQQAPTLTTAIGECGISLMVAHSPGWVHGYSTATAGTLSIMQLATEEGPCPEVLATGRSLYLADLETETRWPMFTVPAKLHDMASVFVQPMFRATGEVVGTIGLYSPWRNAYSDEDRRELASFATVLAQMTTRATDLDRHRGHPTTAVADGTFEATED